MSLSCSWPTSDTSRRGPSVSFLVQTCCRRCSWDPSSVLSRTGGPAAGAPWPRTCSESLPSLGLPAATALYGAASDFGYTLGPVVAAGGLVLVGAEILLVANGLTFAISAVVLWKLSWGQTAPTAEPAALRPVRSILREARDGVRLAARLRGTRTVLFAGGALLFFGGLLNVAELILATEELDVGETGFASLVAVFGLGFIGGSLSGSKGGGLPLLKRRFLGGALAWGLGTLAAGLAPNLLFALVAFAYVASETESSWFMSGRSSRARCPKPRWPVRLV